MAIVASFAVDVVIKEIAELIIVLHLWRFIEIIEELSVGVYRPWSR